MDKGQLSKEKKTSFWISITGYRTLIVLKTLMEKSCTKKELQELLLNNKITKNSVSEDTILVVINTLKAAGCKISKPNKSNNYKYELIYHPFDLNLSEEELYALNLLRDRISEELSLQQIIKINNLYDKLIALTNNEVMAETVKNTKPLGNINEKVLNELSNSSIIGKRVQIQYKSSTDNNIEQLDIIPYRPVYENKRIYLWCYIFKYQTNTLLNFSRILKINSINISEKYDINNEYEVIYTIKDSACIDFELKDYEEITEKKDNYIKIKAHVSNEFWFIQRILQFGADFKIVSPNFFKQKLINKIKLMQKRYEV